MVRPKSEFWTHVTEVTAAGGSVSCVCIHCDKKVVASATRIREHLHGIPRTKHKDVHTCTSNYAKQLRASASEERTPTDTDSIRGSSSTIEGQPLRRTWQRDIRDVTDASTSSSLQAFVDAVAEFGKAYTLPSAYKVAGPLLAKLKVDTEELVQPLKDSWPRSGCTLMVDGWTCLKSRGMICVIAQNDSAPVIVDCVDSKTAKKTGEYLGTLIGGAMETVGDRHVVQVVMDNAANNKRAAQLLKPGYPHVFFNNCAAHVLDLMLHDIVGIKVVKKVLNQVHRVVMMVKGSASAVILFHELFSKLMLSLKEMVISEEWGQVAVAQKEEGRAVRRLLLQETFWESVGVVLRLMNSIYEVLRAVDRRSLVMGQIYGLMLDATLKTNEAATAAARVQRRDRNRLNATTMTDVAFVAFGRRARAAHDRKAELRAKLYEDLSNGTLNEGSTLNPTPEEEVEVDAEEEGGEPCTIDWDNFGSIGKRAKKRSRSDSKKKSSNTKGSGSRKGKEKIPDDADEEESADSDCSGGDDEPAKRKNTGTDPWDCSDGDSREEEDEEEDDEDEEVDG
ncbi:unnamed protein product [Closterium sp. NIES-54]